MVFGKPDIHIEKKNIRHMSIAMLKNSHQMYQRLECKHRNNEWLDKNTSSILHGIGVRKGFLKILSFAPKSRPMIYK